MKRSACAVYIVFITILITSPAFSQAPADAQQWDRLKFLVGEWIGEGSGQPGEGGGYFSFTPDLQNRILVRKNHTVYPESKERHASIHDDLMIVYMDNDSTLKAIYFDNERHIINYTVDVYSDTGKIFFTSPASQTEPQFRLVYEKIGVDRVKIVFETAPARKSGMFSIYLEGTAHRQK